MNRLSWDTTALRRGRPSRPRGEEELQRPLQDDLLRPAWLELRRIHRF